MLQIKLLTKWFKLALFFCGLLLVNCMTWLVTSTNQKEGVYPVDADSIGIPIMITIYASLLMVPILFIISLLSNKDVLLRLRVVGVARLAAVKVGLLLLYASALLFTVYGFMYWYNPNHYLIAASYFVLGVVLLAGLVFDWVTIKTDLGHSESADQNNERV